MYNKYMKKRLKKSLNKELCGVCAGIAEYLNVDPTIIRLITVLFTLSGGCGVLLYIIGALIMPNE